MSVADLQPVTYEAWALRDGRPACVRVSEDAPTLDRWLRREGGGIVVRGGVTLRTVGVALGVQRALSLAAHAAYVTGVVPTAPVAAPPSRCADCDEIVPDHRITCPRAPRLHVVPEPAPEEPVAQDDDEDEPHPAEGTELADDEDDEEPAPAPCPRPALSHPWRPQRLPPREPAAPVTTASVEPAPTAPEAPAAQEPTMMCKVTGCSDDAAGVRNDTDPALKAFCRRHRKIAMDRAGALGTSRAAEAKRLAAEGDVVKPVTSKPTPKPAATTSEPAQPAPQPTATFDGETITTTVTVTVPLPPEAAEALVLARRVGGIDRLRSLVEAALALRGAP